MAKQPPDSYELPANPDDIFPYVHAGKLLGGTSVPGLHDLIDAGLLMTVKIGKKRFTKRAWVYECVAALTTEKGRKRLMAIKEPKNRIRRLQYAEQKSAAIANADQTAGHS